MLSYFITNQNIPLQSTVTQRRNRGRRREENASPKFLRKVSPSLTVKQIKYKQAISNEHPFLIDARLFSSYCINSKEENATFIPRSIYQPKDPYSVIKLMKKLNISLTFDSVCWSFAERLNDPILFIQAFCTLFNERSDLLSSFNFEPSFYDLFLDRFSPFIDVCPINDQCKSLNEIRLTLINLIVNMLLMKWDVIPANLSQSKFVWSRILKFANFSEPYIQIEVFRIAAHFHKSLIPLTDKFDTIKRIEKMLDIISPDTFIYNQCIFLATETAPCGFVESSIAYNILKKKTFDHNDLLAIEKLLTSQKKKRPFFILRFLFIEVTSNLILSKCISNLIAKVLPLYKLSYKFTRWITNYIEISFEFLSNADRLNCFPFKQSNIAYFMTVLNCLKITWLSNLITKHAGALLSLGRCKKLLGCNFKAEKTEPSFILIHKKEIKRDKGYLRNIFNCSYLEVVDAYGKELKKRKAFNITSNECYYNCYPFSVVYDYVYC